MSKTYTEAEYNALVAENKKLAAEKAELAAKATNGFTPNYHFDESGMLCVDLVMGFKSRSNLYIDPKYFVRGEKMLTECLAFCKANMGKEVKTTTRKKMGDKYVPVEGKVVLGETRDRPERSDKTTTVSANGTLSAKLSSLTDAEKAEIKAAMGF